MRIVSFHGGFGELLDGPDGAESTEVRVLGTGGAGLHEFLADPSTVAAARAEDRRRPLSELQLLPAVPRPNKIICVGRNYREHAAERAKPMPTEPMLFPKFGTSLVGDGAEVTIPRIVEDCDWEAELVVVIGAPAFDVTEAQAMDHVAGYLCGNDLSARTLQKQGVQWLRGKAIDGFLPIGPWLTTADAIDDPEDLRISCTVNGETVQDSTTSELHFGIRHLISFISQTLHARARRPHRDRHPRRGRRRDGPAPVPRRWRRRRRDGRAPRHADDHDAHALRAGRRVRPHGVQGERVVLTARRWWRSARGLGGRTRVASVVINRLRAREKVAIVARGRSSPVGAGAIAALGEGAGR